MNYTVDFNNTLYDLIDEQISRVAAQAYTDESIPMYDSVMLHSSDRDEIIRLNGDAVNTLIKRNSDIVSLSVNGAGNTVLTFTVPDFDTSMEDTVKEEITSFIVLNVCAAWFQARAKDKVEEFANRAQVALDKASVLLHTRKKPTR